MGHRLIAIVAIASSIVGPPAAGRLRPPDSGTTTARWRCPRAPPRSWAVSSPGTNTESIKTSLARQARARVRGDEDQHRQPSRAFWRVEVVRTLRRRGPLPNAGESIPRGWLGGSGAVSFDLVALKALQYAPAGATRQTIVDGIGRGIGLVAAHELAHQMIHSARRAQSRRRKQLRISKPGPGGAILRRSAVDDGAATAGADAAMRFTGLTPTLYTRDIPGSIDFYVNALGFSREGPDGSGVAFVRRGRSARRHAGNRPFAAGVPRAASRFSTRRPTGRRSSRATDRRRNGRCCRGPTRATPPCPSRRTRRPIGTPPARRPRQDGCSRSWPADG